MGVVLDEVEEGGAGGVVGSVFCFGEEKCVRCLGVEGAFWV